LELDQTVSAYRSFDPAGWVSLYRHLPMWGGIIAVAVGVVLLLFGGGKAFRLVAGPIGAVAGSLWAPVIVGKLGITGAEGRVGVIAAVLLAGIGFAFPPGVVFFAFGLPAGLFAGEMAGSADWLLGFVPAFLLVGALAAAVHRHIGAVAASLAGAWLLVIGMLAALHQVGGLVEAVASQPWGVIVAAALFAVAGSVYQLAVRANPEEAEALRLERLRAKKKLEEKKALEKRWANYSDQDKS
jgi:hypothetical protein